MHIIFTHIIITFKILIKIKILNVNVANLKLRSISQVKSTNMNLINIIYKYSNFIPYMLQKCYAVRKHHL